MGVIRPPWIDKEWFSQCPFNYCDHFGDKEQLATVCRICREEIDRIEEYKRQGKDPYDWGNVFKEIGESLAEAMMMIHKQAEDMGIDLENIPDGEYSEVDRENNLTYKVAQQYGDRVERVLRKLEIIPVSADTALVTKAIDALSHSRSYVGAKIYRALSSKLREEREPYDDLYDSKTSALFAYVAIERNSRVLMALAQHKPLFQQRKQFLPLAKLSVELCEMIKAEFFPDDTLVYQEFGCDEYYQFTGK